jgi:hypothetical protein
MENVCPLATVGMSPSPINRPANALSGGTLVDQAVAQTISASPASGFTFVEWKAVPSDDAVFGDGFQQSGEEMLAVFFDGAGRHHQEFITAQAPEGIISPQLTGNHTHQTF